jgi:glycerophosphoryl diester phosphodiesterase
VPPLTVIAHRGASGYRPEHTLEAVTLAHAMGAHYIEQDVVLTRDGHLIVLHDLYLDAVTDVAEKFPGRGRENGRHYAIDFDLEEIRQLRVHERRLPDGSPAFPERTWPNPGSLLVPTLCEEIDLIQKLNRVSGRETGIYVEPKSPAWHRSQGRDLVAEVVRELDRHGYRERNDAAFLQSFEPGALQRARHELGCDLKLVQLIGENSWKESDADYDFLRTREGLESIGGHTDGIGPWLPQIFDLKRPFGADISELLSICRELGLFVHAYTLRADQLPATIPDMDAAIRLLSSERGPDGVFTDHPDQVLSRLESRRRPADPVG